MKLFKTSVILQIIYCTCCMLVCVCMPLYHEFYTTPFGDICFKIGATLTLVSTFNPMGLFGVIISWFSFFNSRSKKELFGSLFSPLIIAISWILSVCFFVGYSGGV